MSVLNQKAELITVTQRQASGLPATLLAGLAVILATEAFLFADIIARDWAVVPGDVLALPSGTLQTTARWVAGNVTPICWVGLLFVLDGILARTKDRGSVAAFAKTSPVRVRPRRFVLCFLASIPIWLIFDAVNFGSVHAWIYHGLPEDPIYRLTGYFFAFGAICPAMFLVAEIFRRLSFHNVPWQSLRIPRRADPYLVGLGVLLLAFPLLVGNPVGTVTLWAGWVLLLDPINRRLKAPSLLADWAAGRWQRTLALLAAGIVCGLLWEFWNYWATAKWTYELAFLGPFEEFRYFEMPVAGLLGFPPFALECWVMFQTMVAVIGRSGLVVAEPLPDEYTVI